MYQRVAVGKDRLGIEKKAAQVDNTLVPLPKRQDKSHTDLLNVLARQDAVLSAILTNSTNGTQYRLVEEETTDHVFFQPAIRENVVAAVINPHHPFYKKLYRPLIDNDTSTLMELGHAIQALLLAAARAEGISSKAADRRTLNTFRQEWSRTLATLLR